MKPSECLQGLLKLAKRSDTLNRFCDSEGYFKSLNVEVSISVTIDVCYPLRPAGV